MQLTKGHQRSVSLGRRRKESALVKEMHVFFVGIFVFVMGMGVVVVRDVLFRRRSVCVALYATL